jgi:CheY-like chemotaxis protein
MSMQFPQEHLAQLRQSAQFLVERTGSHQEELEGLAASADRTVRQAQTITAEVVDADLNEVRHLLYGDVQRSLEGAARARTLCASAREQHSAACRLLAALDSEPAPSHSRTNAVLVVDDYPDVRDLVARVLLEAGFMVRTAPNGLEGLIAAYEMRPHVIVMDVAMPVLNGIEATRLIKANKATREARVIAHTGSPTGDDIGDVTLFSAVLQKPAPPGVVLATVQQFANL